MNSVLDVESQQQNHLNRAQGIRSGQDQDIYNLQVKAMSNFSTELDKYVASMRKMASLLNKGQAENLKNMENAVKGAAQTFKALEKLVEDSEDLVNNAVESRANREILNQYKNQLAPLFAIIEKGIEDTKEAEIKANEEIQKRIRANNEEFLRSNRTIIDELGGSLRTASGNISATGDDLTASINGFLTATNNHQRNVIIERFAVEKEEYDRMVESFSQSFDEIRESLDADTREMYQDTLNTIRRQQSLYNTFYRQNMEDAMSFSGELWRNVREGFREIRTGFNTVKDIFDTINIHRIAQSLMGGAESQIDVMSQVSRTRGMGYGNVKDQWFDNFNASDTYGGAIGASEIMRIYQMNNLNTDYLSDIASSVALFEKETELGNDSLNGMLLWAQNTGISRGRTVEVLDYLQSIRDDGADIQSILAFQNENAALVSGHEEEFAAAMGAFQALGLNATDLQKIVGSGNTVMGTRDQQLIALLGRSGRLQEAEQLANAQNYTELASFIAEAISQVANDIGDNPMAVGMYADRYGLTANEIRMFTESYEDHITVEDFNKKLDELINSDGTLEENAESVGFVSEAERIYNEAETTWLGNRLVDIQEAIQNHPIISSILGTVGGNVISSALKTKLPKFGGGATAAGGGAATTGSAGVTGAGVTASTAGATEAGVTATTAATTEASVAATEAATAATSAAEASTSVASAAAGIAGMTAAITGAVSVAKYFTDVSNEEFVNRAGDHWYQGMYSAQDILDFYNANSSVGNTSITDLGNASTIANLIEAGWLTVGDTSGDGKLDSYQWTGKTFDASTMSFDSETGQVIDQNGNVVRNNNSIQDFTIEHTQKLEDLYSIVDKIYNKELSYNGKAGSNAAQAYVNEEIVPLLQQWGVDQNVLNAYKNDVGKNDFMEDIENGVFGDIKDITKQIEKPIFTIDESMKTITSDVGNIYDILDSAPGHAGGLSYVPYNNYIARLHEGERVLTKQEASEYDTVDNQYRDSSMLYSALSRIGNNKDFQKIVKDGFEYVGKKLQEVVEASGNISIPQSNAKNTLTSMYLRNQWG